LRRLCACGCLRGRNSRRRRFHDKTGDGFRELGPALLPVIDAVERKTDRFLVLAGDRVVKADALDEAAVAAIARVGDHYVEERALLGASTGKSNDDHCLVRPIGKTDNFTTKMGVLASHPLSTPPNSLRGTAWRSRRGRRALLQGPV